MYRELCRQLGPDLGKKQAVSFFILRDVSPTLSGITESDNSKMVGKTINAAVNMWLQGSTFEGTRELPYGAAESQVLFSQINATGDALVGPPPY